ncbi:TPA: phospho-N-acetylmuramoyl-pentapeptide-transferase [Patescibacteria group bacterium]|nr:phospho-N-acetylmuramoyl-pentapeptide-transferase [Patescibacteria group bacterium]
MITELLIKIFSLTIIGFLFAIAITPLWTKLLFKYRLGKQIRNDGSTPLYSELHGSKAGTPTMGGVIVWGTVVILAFTFWFLDRVIGIEQFHVLNFLTRKETLLPLGALLGAAVVGLMDDYLDIRRLGHKGRGFRFRFKIILYTAVAMIGAWWFYFKLGFDFVNIPFYGDIIIGWWFIPFFLLVTIGTSFAVNQTDGLDGLAGGVLLVAFVCFAVISFMQGRDDLTALLGVVSGALLAFLWFNVYPARFFMGDTGSMGLGVLLAIVAFLTNSVLLLPLIGLIFVIEAGSFFIQMFWRVVFKKKFFLSAPIHHHLEALGWPEAKVTMRFWILSSIAGIMSIIIFFLAR